MSAAELEQPDRWQDHASCKDTPIDCWFSPADEGGVEPTAIALCALCPVHGDCLEHALRYEKHGYWAGTSERARRRIRRSAGIRLIEHDPDRIAPALRRGAPDEEDPPAWP